MSSEILIKGMVCDRCVSVVKEGLMNLGFEVSKVSLGKVLLNTDISKEDYDRVRDILNENGFELIFNRQVRIVNQAKDLVNEAFGGAGKCDVRLKFSSLLSEKLHMNYDSISELFTRVEGVTLEKYIITRRLEKVKKLLVYTELTLTEIAHITGFSSISHVSRQFKELTGLSPSRFKSIRPVLKKPAAKV